ncbi:cupin domain-containing protein [Gloeocapsa sp. BRSZ]
MSSQAIRLIHPYEGKTIDLVTSLVTFKVIVDDNSGEASIIEMTPEPQDRAPLHRHAAETFYVLEGEFEFFGADPDAAFRATAGDYVHIPAGVPHGWVNIGTTTGRLQIVTVSNWFQSFLEEIATLESPADAEAIGQIGQKHGIEILE